MVAIVVAFCFFLIFFFVPETFWDRTPTARGRSQGKHHPHLRMPSLHRHEKNSTQPVGGEDKVHGGIMTPRAGPETPRLPRTVAHVGFADDAGGDITDSQHIREFAATPSSPETTISQQDYFNLPHDEANSEVGHSINTQNNTSEFQPSTTIKTVNPHHDIEKKGTAFQNGQTSESGVPEAPVESDEFKYTEYYRAAPPKSYIQSLKPWNGRLAKDKWIHVMIRPFILYAYPAVLWSSMVYALAVGWLIVLSESVAHIYRDRESYNFTALQVGLVYISPFVGGVLGTAVAGKISDIVVRFMARKNDGVYEPEYRLVMAIPITLATTVGLMGFGWSAEEKDNWIVPTVFFGIISFGCSLASTTAVTFVVDSYRVYAGESLVTLNFSKSKFLLLIKWLCWY